MPGKPHEWEKAQKIYGFSTIKIVISAVISAKYR